MLYLNIHTKNNGRSTHSSHNPTLILEGNLVDIKLDHSIGDVKNETIHAGYK